MSMAHNHCPCWHQHHPRLACHGNKLQLSPIYQLVPQPGSVTAEFASLTKCNRARADVVLTRHLRQNKLSQIWHNIVTKQVNCLCA